MRYFLLLLCLAVLGQSAIAKTTNVSADTTGKKAVFYPIPAVPKLFYIQRDPNNNTIVYALNQDDKGDLNPENPVHVFWIKYNEQSQKEELNFLQRKFAYGLVSKALGNNAYELHFVSYKKFPLLLKRSESDHKYHIYATIANRQAILNRVFIRIVGGTFWFPNVLYVEVKGTDPVTGKDITERFKP